MPSSGDENVPASHGVPGGIIDEVSIATDGRQLQNTLARSPPVKGGRDSGRGGARREGAGEREESLWVEAEGAESAIRGDAEEEAAAVGPGEALQEVVPLRHLRQSGQI